MDGMLYSEPSAQRLCECNGWWRIWNGLRAMCQSEAECGSSARVCMMWFASSL